MAVKLSSQEPAGAGAAPTTNVHVGAPEERFAVVYVPGRLRGRISASCVEVVPSAQRARQLACHQRRRYAARVYGPSRSSEGHAVYYLAGWLAS